MILDAETLELAPRVDVFLGRDGFKTELFATMLELNTPVCRTPEEVGEVLGSLRRDAAEVAEENGLRIAASGSHPISDPEEQEIVDEPRYRDFVEYAGVSARRQGVHGLHVHVGMPDLGDLPARHGRRAAVDAGRARDLRQLALPLGTRDGAHVEPRRDPRAASPPRRPARRLAGRRRADGRPRHRRRRQRALVGRAPQPEVRDARVPRRRPAHGAGANRRVRRADPVACASG